MRNQNGTKAVQHQETKPASSEQLGSGASPDFLVVVTILVLGILKFLSIEPSVSKSRRYRTRDGYIKRKSRSGRDRFVHREVAEMILGRALRRDEVVHHINGRPADNREENLCVMTRVNHDKYHNWYDWIVETYGNYPRRETQLRKLREDFGGTLLMDVSERRKKAG